MTDEENVTENKKPKIGYLFNNLNSDKEGVERDGERDDRESKDSRESGESREQRAEGVERGERVRE